MVVCVCVYYSHGFFVGLIYEPILGWNFLYVKLNLVASFCLLGVHVNCIHLHFTWSTYLFIVLILKKVLTVIGWTQNPHWRLCSFQATSRFSSFYWNYTFTEARQGD